MLDRRIGCVAWDPNLEDAYGYRPSLVAGVGFIVLFGGSMLLHTVQTIWKRQWWQSVFAIGALAPCFFTAGCYVVLGRLIPILGPESSPLSPKRYLLIFSTCDLLSIIVQAIGGGHASAQDNKVNGNTKPGTDIMIGGIVFQMASITVFGALFSYILFRARNVRLSKGLRLTIAATALAVVLIYIRSIYRTMELLQGWKGFLITHERYFIAFDGSMMAAAVIVFNIINPAWFLVAPESTNPEEGLYGSKTESTKS